MSQHSYKLTYFDAEARAEPIRLAFHFAGVPFVDERVARDQWPALKTSVPWHSLPLLTIDGKTTIGQSVAILEYVGKLSSLYPADAFKAAKVMEAMMAFEDLGNELGPSLREQDPEKKKAMRLVLAEKTIPEHAQRLEKFLAATSAGPYLLGQDISIADFRLGGVVKFLQSGLLDHIPKDILAPYPRITQSYKAVFDHPKIKEYYANKAKQ